MPSMMRITGWFSLIFGFILFFIFQGRLDLISSIAGGVVLLSILAVLMFTGRHKIIPPSISEEGLTQTTSETSPVIAILPSVNEVESVSDNRDEKLQRSRRKSKELSVPLPTMPLPTIPPPDSSQLPPPTMVPLPPSFPDINPHAAEGTKLAKKLVVTSDAQSEMESEIEAFVDQRRSKQAEIRSSLERKRRMVLAERRAAKARLWTEVEDGEDLATLLQDPNHGLTIIEEPEFPDESKPIGVSYIRIDNTRILKIKVPLEVVNKEKSVNESETTDISDFPPPPGLPPLPPPPGLPPLPPPPGLPPE